MIVDCARLGFMVAIAVVLIWFGWPVAVLLGGSFLWWATIAFVVDRANDA